MFILSKQTDAQVMVVMKMQLAASVQAAEGFCVHTAY